MTDFISAFKSGIDAAKIAEKNKIEIQSVFDDLNNQLDRESGGKLRVDIKEYSENSAIEDFAAILAAKPRPVYFAVTACNPLAGGGRVQLARWSVGRSGYPCRIYLGSSELINEDKESLEKSLQSLLADPVVGEKLYKLMSLELIDDGEATSQS